MTKHAPPEFVMSDQERLAAVLSAAKPFAAILCGYSDKASDDLEVLCTLPLGRFRTLAKTIYVDAGATPGTDCDAFVRDIATKLAPGK